MTVWLSKLFFMWKVILSVFFFNLLSSKRTVTYLSLFLTPRIYVGYIPRSRTAGSYSNSVFNFLKNCQNVFHICCTILQSHQQCITVLCSPYPYQHLLLVFWVWPTVVSIKWYLTVVLICIRLMLMMSSIFFMGLLAICASFLERCLSRFFAQP